MTVWVVSIKIPFEGESLEEIFSTEAAADRYAEKRRKEDPHTVSFEVVEVEVKE